MRFAARLVLLSLASTVPCTAGTPAAAPRRSAWPEIAKFSTSPDEAWCPAGGGTCPDGPGPLRIVYADGTEVTVPNEHGRFGSSRGSLTQQEFSGTALAPDRRTLGWMADYMICGTSYPCDAVLVLFRQGRVVRSFGTSFGTLLSWSFLDGGAKVATSSGYTHGNNPPYYELFSVASGRRLARYSGGPRPAWADQAFPAP